MVLYGAETGIVSGHLAERIESLCPGMGLTKANQGSWPEQGVLEKLEVCVL